jgi:hypothetical protein
MDRRRCCAGLRYSFEAPAGMDDFRVSLESVGARQRYVSFFIPERLQIYVDVGAEGDASPSVGY